MAASVPMSVAKSEADSVNKIVVQNASIIMLLENNSRYQLNVNPPQITLDLELLKDNTINTKMGRYKNKKIRTKYNFSILFFTILQFPPYRMNDCS